MGITAENLAKRGQISRERQEAFAVCPHQRPAQARVEAWFADEIVPVSVKSRRETIEFTEDEHIRLDSTTEAMTGLRPV